MEPLPDPAYDSGIEDAYTDIRWDALQRAEMLNARYRQGERVTNVERAVEEIVAETVWRLHTELLKDKLSGDASPDFVGSETYVDTYHEAVELATPIERRVRAVAPLDEG